MLGMLERVALKGKPSKESQMSREKGSKMLLRRPPPKILGISDIFYVCCRIDLLRIPRTSSMQASNNFLMIKLMERTCYILGVTESCGTFPTFLRYFLFGLWRGTRCFCNLLLPSIIYLAFFHPYWALFHNSRPISKFPYRPDQNGTIRLLTPKGI